MSVSDHLRFLERAVEIAEANIHKGGGPFGCVIVRDGVVIAEGANQVALDLDPTAHAEVHVIRLACKALNNFELSDCIIYASCEPCPMCLGAIYWSRAKACYFASSREDAAIAGFDDDFIYKEIPKDFAKRSVPFQQIPSTKAADLFQIWKEKLDKVEY